MFDKNDIIITKEMRILTENDKQRHANKKYSAFGR